MGVSEGRKTSDPLVGSVWVAAAAEAVVEAAAQEVTVQAEALEVTAALAGRRKTSAETSTEGRSAPDLLVPHVAAELVVVMEARAAVRA